MTKLMFASDLHGDLDAVNAILAAFEREGAERLVLLGDLLYHGPRNDLPPAYAPKEVIARLTEYADRILAVRGNCDTEVDQMVLPFPILADYAVLFVDGVTVYLTHGHRFSPEAPPPMQAGDILVSGHTHVAGRREGAGGTVCLNPGSPAIPKEGTPRGYMILEDGVFSLRDLNGKEYAAWKAKR